MEPLSVGVILYCVDKNTPFFLLLKHNKTIYGWNHWDFVKGKPIKNETEIQTALREVVEETNLKEVKIKPNFRAISKYSFIKNSGEKAYKEVIYFLGEINKNDKNKVKISNEHERYEFVRIEKVKDYIEFDEMKKVFDEVIKYF